MRARHPATQPERRDLREVMAELLEASPYDQKAIAARMGIAAPTVSQMLRRDPKRQLKAPSVDTVWAFCEAIGISFEQFLRVARWLPKTTEEDLNEILAVASALDGDKRRSLYDYAKFLYREDAVERSREETIGRESSR